MYDSNNNKKAQKVPRKRQKLRLHLHPRNPLTPFTNGRGRGRPVRVQFNSYMERPLNPRLSKGFVFIRLALRGLKARWAWPGFWGLWGCRIPP